MIQAAINPETGEFLGLIIPKEDLDGDSIAITGTAENWEAAMRGADVGDKIAVYKTHVEGTRTTIRFGKLGRVTPLDNLKGSGKE